MRRESSRRDPRLLASRSLVVPRSPRSPRNGDHASSLETPGRQVARRRVDWRGRNLHDLAPVGPPGCLLQTLVGVLVAANFNGSGFAGVSLGIPNQPNLVGASLTGQFFALDPSGFATSQGVGGQIR